MIPELKESDLEESFVRGRFPLETVVPPTHHKDPGSGPGGQSINKTNNNVQLLHKPTGIQVKCQETRSLQQNRKIARKILLGKVCILHDITYHHATRLIDCGSLIVFIILACRKRTLSGPASARGTEEGERKRKRQRPPRQRMSTQNDLPYPPFPPSSSILLPSLSPWKIHFAYLTP